MVANSVGRAARFTGSRRQAARGLTRVTLCTVTFLALVLALHHPATAERDVIPVAALWLAFAAMALLWPSLDEVSPETPMGSLIAVVGCDGSGKSTLTHDLNKDLSASVAVQTCYLGLGSGAIGERIKRVPLVGAAFERKLARKAAQTRTKGERIPGLATALVVYLFSLARLRRFRRMLDLRRRGFVVLTDRYPQVECPGFYDGPGLSAASASGWAVAALARRERRLYQWMASFRPNVVIRLNVDVDTAAARKPDHRRDLLAKKVAVTPQLRFAGARIVDLDAVAPYEAVHAAAARTVMDVVAHAA